MAQSIFIPKAATGSDLAALDYFTASDAVYPADTACAPAGANQHPLVAFPDDDASNNVFFPGVMGQDYGGGFLTVSLFWVAPATMGDVVWFVSWERDNALPGGANLNADSYGIEKSIVSVSPGVSGEIQKAIIIFTAAEADGIVGGDPYRLRVRRNSSVLFDTLVGGARLFRVSFEGIP